MARHSHSYAVPDDFDEALFDSEANALFFDVPDGFDATAEELGDLFEEDGDDGEGCGGGDVVVKGTVVSCSPGKGAATSEAMGTAEATDAAEDAGPARKRAVAGMGRSVQSTLFGEEHEGKDGVGENVAAAATGSTPQEPVSSLSKSRPPPGTERLASWLESLGLGSYLTSLLDVGIGSMESVASQSSDSVAAWAMSRGLSGAQQERLIRGVATLAEEQKLLATTSARCTASNAATQTPTALDAATAVHGDATVPQPSEPLWGSEEGALPPPVKPPVKPPVEPTVVELSEAEIQQLVQQAQDTDAQLQKMNATHLKNIKGQMRHNDRLLERMEGSVAESVAESMAGSVDDSVDRSVRTNAGGGVSHSDDSGSSGDAYVRGSDDDSDDIGEKKCEGKGNSGGGESGDEGSEREGSIMSSDDGGEGDEVMGGSTVQNSSRQPRGIDSFANT